MPLENNPECLYHPRLPKFKDIWGVNTQCAEQTFSWTNTFKFIAKNLTQFMFKFFVNVVVENRNTFLEKRLMKELLNVKTAMLV